MNHATRECIPRTVYYSCHYDDYHDAAGGNDDEDEDDNDDEDDQHYHMMMMMTMMSCGNVFRYCTYFLGMHVHIYV